MAHKRNGGESSKGGRRGRRRGHSEGLVRKRGDGRWEGRISLGWRDGRRLQRSYYRATQAEILETLTKVRNDIRLGLPVASDRQTIEGFLKNWLEESAGPRIKPRTHERFSELIRLHIREGRMGARE